MRPAVVSSVVFTCTLSVLLLLHLARNHDSSSTGEYNQEHHLKIPPRQEHLRRIFHPASKPCVDLLLLWECQTPRRCLSSFSADEIVKWSPPFLRNSCRSLLKELEDETPLIADLQKEEKFRPGDIVVRSQLQLASAVRPLFVPHEQRRSFMTPFPPSLEIQICGNTTAGSVDVILLHPVSMATPREMFIAASTTRAIRRSVGLSLPELTPFSDLFPRPPEAAQKRFGVNHEVLAIMSAMRSLFGLTTRRAGWDCARHYEYLAYGVLPYFPDLPVAPKHCVAGLPKSLLNKVIRLPAVAHNGALMSLHSPPFETSAIRFRGPGGETGGSHIACLSAGTVNFSRFDRNEYLTLSNSVTRYARRYLSTRSVAAYVLHRAKLDKTVKRVLLIFCVTNYLEFNQVSLHHGLVDLGIEVTAFPRLEAHYKRRVANMSSEAVVEKLAALREEHLQSSHGWGYLWGFRVYDDAADRDDASADTIARGLADRAYDCVVYAGLLPSVSLSELPFVALVTKVYSHDQIIFVATADWPGNAEGASEESLVPQYLVDASRVGQVFVRELHQWSGRCKT